MAVQHMQQLAAQAARGSRGAAAQQQYGAGGNPAVVDPSSLSAHLQGLQDLLAACEQAAGGVSAGCDSNEGFAHPANPCAAPDGDADGAKPLLVQAAVASKSLQAAEQVGGGAERVCLL
jgi:hypothetical protein